MLTRVLPPWHVRESQTTPEGVFENRRELIRKLGRAGIGAALAAASAPAAYAARAAGSPSQSSGKTAARIPTADLYPAQRNPQYAIEEPLTPENIASRHNVFDEFALERDKVWKAVSNFTTRPWRIHVGGAVEKPVDFDVDK